MGPFIILDILLNSISTDKGWSFELASFQGKPRDYFYRISFKTTSHINLVILVVLPSFSLGFLLNFAWHTCSGETIIVIKIICECVELGSGTIIKLQNFEIYFVKGSAKCYVIGSTTRNMTLKTACELFRCYIIEEVLLLDLEVLEEP
jgi:hypothetical protein